METVESIILQKRIRIVFWIVGLFLGGLLAYTTRYFINGDAIAYIEMGEAIRTGEWSRLVNLTFSPGYSVLLGIGELLLRTDPMNELQTLRIVNFFCFAFAMAMCDLMLGLVRKDLVARREDGRASLPGPVFSALWYSAFLVASLVLIRIRLLNPDMLVFAIVLASVSAILWIRNDPRPYFKYAVLGACAGAGYLVKSFFLPFSPVLFFLAGTCSHSIRKAAPRVIVATAVMLVVAAPLMTALSLRLGRFTYGELGRHVYASLISGKGTPIHPEALNETPRVTRYVYDLPCTQPSGHDICYFHEGLKPNFDVRAHLKLIPGTVTEMFTQTPWLLLIGLWFAALWWMGCLKVKAAMPPSVFGLFTVVAVCGVAFYCLIRMEPRYIAPYLFVGFVGLSSCLTYLPPDHKAGTRAVGASLALTVFFLGLVGYTAVDQSVRALISLGDKPSYQAQFGEIVAVKDFLISSGVQKGDEVSIVGLPPSYWARMVGARIVTEVNDADQFLASTPEQRKKAVQALEAVKSRAVVAKDTNFRTLGPEGWQLVPGTRDYYVLFPGGRGR